MQHFQQIALASGVAFFSQKLAFVNRAPLVDKFLASPTTKLILVLLSFAALVLSSSCAKRQRESSLSNQLTTRTASQNQATSEIGAVPRTNINTASATELEKLPGIGKALAERIVEHREKYGPFRRPEHLITVRGISDHRFRALRDLITVE